MEQKFLEDKAKWIGKMEWGDMTEAARIAGVTRATFQEWLQMEGVRGSEVDKRNLKALKQAVSNNKRKKDKDLAEAIAA